MDPHLTEKKPPQIPRHNMPPLTQHHGPVRPHHAMPPHPRPTQQGGMQRGEIPPEPLELTQRYHFEMNVPQQRAMSTHRGVALLRQY